MPVMDEFKKERDAVKNGTPKQKLSYFIYYYKWYVIAAVLVVAAVVSMIRHYVNQKDIAFYACFLNSAKGENAEEYVQSFADYAGIDTDTYAVCFDSSILINDPNENPETLEASSQKLMVYIAAGNLDVLLTDANSIKHYANAQLFCDMRDFLTPAQIKLYEPYFYYVDQTVVQELQESLTNPEQKYIPDYPDPTKPEEMDQPIPVGIWIENPGALADNYAFLDGGLVLAVFPNAKNPEAASKFIDFLMQQ